MAVTEITQSVKDITGISSLSANGIEDAQKFAISSIPKDLLLFAQKVSSSSTDGSAISFSINDSITDVQRNGYSCKEISMAEANWVLDSTSLKFKSGLSSLAIIAKTIPGNPAPEPRSATVFTPCGIFKKTCAESKICLVQILSTLPAEIKFIFFVQTLKILSYSTREAKVSRETLKSLVRNLSV